MSATIRILLLADTHLGFDLPVRARVRRRRRGDDFLANYGRALAPAAAGEVDMVVHGGDVFHRSRVASSLAWQAFEPLARIARGGIPVFLVPGNHERGRFPHMRFAAQPGVHVFDRPCTHRVDVGGVTVALSGFPFERRAIRTRFAEVVERTGWREVPARVRLLCVHQCIEGAKVGPGDFTFTAASDVIRGRDVPADFAAVLSGHIHRHQVLTRDLRRRPLGSPVLYPGSIERTSVAERGEVKGYLIVSIACGQEPGVTWEFRPLPSRPLVMRELCLAGVADDAVDGRLRALIASVPVDAVLRIRVTGGLTERVRARLCMARLRRLAPPTMNIELRGDDETLRSRGGHRSTVQRDTLELPLDRDPGSVGESSDRRASGSVPAGSP